MSTPKEIDKKIKILTKVIKSKKSSFIRKTLSINVVEVLLLSKKRLNSKEIDKNRKEELTEMLTLLFMQVTKIEKGVIK